MEGLKEEKKTRNVPDQKGEVHLAPLEISTLVMEKEGWRERERDQRRGGGI